MAVENIPWMVQGGIHSASSGRRVLYKATSGAEGVDAIGDLKVAQQVIAAGSVLVAAGGCTMVNRYPGITGESYGGYNLTPTAVNIAANGSGGVRRDLIVARIDDWNFPGSQATPASLPTDTVPVFKLAVIQGVPAGTTKAVDSSGNPLPYPAIPLARIDIPNGTAAITNAMITDLRRMTNPRRQRFARTRAITAAELETLTNAVGEQWPNVATWNVEVPSWASVAQVSLRLAGVLFPGGDTAGQVWVRLGNGDPAMVETQTVGFDSAGTAGSQRIGIECSDDRDMPAALRGKVIQVIPMAKVTSGASGARPKMDGLTSVTIDIEFLEAPAQDA